MHPAKSVILFTTASGAGYGLLFWLSLFPIYVDVPVEQTFGLIAFGLALGLVVVGLMASTFHLGHPERAWRAMSQWRSSWLSREGVAAVLSFAPAGLYALDWVFFGVSDRYGHAFGLGTAALAIITVYCTSMIYASLKTIPAWSNKYTSLLYLALSLMTGGLLFTVLASFFGYEVVGLSTKVTLAFLLIGLALKIVYYKQIDGADARSTAESATGLGFIGKVRLLEPPHTQPNYLMKEMGFEVARKHSAKLRRIAIILGFVLPFIVLYLSPFGNFMDAALAVTLGAIGIVTERWLFFAEAKHVVMLYYGEEKV